MTDEYIRKQDAMQIAFKSPFFSDALMEEINSLPSADVAPVRHARWRHYEGVYVCEACGAQLDDESPFCPMCGAKMDGDES